MPSEDRLELSELTLRHRLDYERYSLARASDDLDNWTPCPIYACLNLVVTLVDGNMKLLATGHATTFDTVDDDLVLAQSST